MAVADRGDIMSEVWPAVRAVFEPILERDAANVRGSFDDLQRQVASACQMGHAPALSDAIMELFDSTTRRRVQRLSELRGGDALLSGTLEIATSHARACASVAVVLHQLVRGPPFLTRRFSIFFLMRCFRTASLLRAARGSHFMRR